MKTGKFPLTEYQEIFRLNPYWSSWVCFCETIKGSNNLSKRTIKKYFEQLIEKDNYVENEKFALLNYLNLLANNPEQCQ